MTFRRGKRRTWRRRNGVGHVGSVADGGVDEGAEGPLVRDVDPFVLVGGERYWSRNGSCRERRDGEEAVDDGSGVVRLVEGNRPVGVLIDPHAEEESADNDLNAAVERPSIAP